jgi:ABC-type dipeptide/oligopeptide/nickel transport system permease subunit
MAEQNEITPTAAYSEAPPRVSGWSRFIRVFFGRKVVIFGLTVVVMLIILAIFAPWIAPHDPYQPHLRDALAQPFTGTEYILGTDSLGRDTLSRIIYGARVSLTVGVMVITLSSIVGFSLGLIAGYFGGWPYIIIMRYVDAQMAIPRILLALAIAALLGGGLTNVVIAIGVGSIPRYARLMCGQVLNVKESDYVTAAHSIGANSMRVMLRHIAPNCFPPLIVMLTMQIGNAIMAEAGLSFLGIGVAPPTSTWGAMVSEGYAYLLENPILSFAPGAAIMLVVFSFNMVGDGLRDALDPRLRGTI